VNDFADSAIMLKILGETLPSKQWEVTGELRKRSKSGVDKEGIDSVSTNGTAMQWRLHQTTPTKKDLNNSTTSVSKKV
jgi:small conductance mechanosensitive channel